MKWLIGLGVLATLAAFSGTTPVQGQEAEAPAPKVGDKAPEFKLVGTDGKTYSSQQFLGKSAVVFAWYPKALTGG